MSITFSRLNCSNDFIEIWHRSTFILEEGYRLLITAMTDIHAGGAASKSQYTHHKLYNMNLFSVVLTNYCEFPFFHMNWHTTNGSAYCLWNEMVLWNVCVSCINMYERRICVELFQVIFTTVVYFWVENQLIYRNMPQGASEWTIYNILELLIFLIYILP